MFLILGVQINESAPLDKLELQYYDKTPVDPSIYQMETRTT